MHLGVSPEAGKAYSGERRGEIWESFRRLIRVCKNEAPDLLLVAGDLFHRQPLLRELKEVDGLFASLERTQVVLIAGNHDYMRRDSYYRTFQWSANVHFLGSASVEAVELPALETAVYGCSYHERQIRQPLYDSAPAAGRQKREILLAHGGDTDHIPVSREALAGLGYDYVALGHIHMPQVVIPGLAAYAGALEPTDRNDTGHHGYIQGEITEDGCRFSFVPFASREYIHCEVEVDRRTTGAGLADLIWKKIEENGIQNMYKFLLKGYRDPDTLFDLDALDRRGNIIDIVDETKPAWDLEKLYRNNKNNLIGRYIESFSGAEKDSVEYRALFEGISALMETRRGTE
ncbi:metallophosphoesterase [Faecalicatena contorta]|uniref:metallophosphoesterase family protein n=1 Tax=Clostridia TaxID=186801 RepID=UPI0014862355|nr:MULTISPECIES: metallophosphoesterase [Clostridia]MBM6684852.1 metallophosphoesterase [Faecalicatena contorta]MBM6709965.1 metallophosphoesterase [Faecalicatena contorta]